MPFEIALIKINFVIKNPRPHYNVNMTAVAVGHDFLNLSANVFGVGDEKGTIIDSGTTLAYLPQVIYDPLIRKVSLMLLFTFNLSNFFIK